MIVTVTIDTEEDDWGSYAADGASTENIQHLLTLQDLLDRYQARPTYLVNRPPLLERRSVDVLTQLAGHEAVEIGAHCHPWNTPPATEGSSAPSMMCALPDYQNRAKIREITQRISGELGVQARCFRAGRWGFGPSVSRALADEGIHIDCSVSPLIDWSSIGGPDFGTTQHSPYRFFPEAPLRPDPRGSMLELPTTIGFLRGEILRTQRARRWLEDHPLSRFKILGLLDHAGFLARRWLSPETSTGKEMIRIASAAALGGAAYIGMTFHSCTLLPGATPFVADAHERSRFLERCEAFLSYSKSAGFEFRTMTEAAIELAPDLVPGSGYALPLTADHERAMERRRPEESLEPRSRA